MADVTPFALNGKRILIAEDEAIIAMILEDVVERIGGVIVQTARSCEDALVAIETLSVDAVILDVHLSGGTSEAIIAAADKKRIPVLVSTGSDRMSLPDAFRALPMLQKPWQSEDVQTALAQLFSTAT